MQQQIITDLNPILKEKVPKTISYTSMMTFINCPRLYYIKYILGNYIMESTIDTIYGKLIHRFCQDLLLGKIKRDEALVKFVKIWQRFCKLYKKHIDKEKYNVYSLEIAGIRIIGNIQNSFLNTFSCKCAASAEEKLWQKIDGYPQSFTGYIDLTFGNAKELILDFKVINSAYMFNRYKDKYKDYQLTLYKYFYAKKIGVVPENVKTYFCLLEKDITSKNPIQFVEVTSGERKVNNALNLMNDTLKGISNKLKHKNLGFCDAYGKCCPFKNTEFCK